MEDFKVSRKWVMKLIFPDGKVIKIVKENDG